MNRTLLDLTRSVFPKRCYVTRTKNFYEILGLQRTATSNEIKGAYYKLSMLYHPDKNKESEEAAEKFRQITAAYEVLGNFRLRKLYDKGIIHSAEEKFRKPQEEEEEDPTARFYQARMNKERRTATGRTPIYNFDEWAEAHYGGEFKRQQKLRNSAKEKKTNTEHISSDQKNQKLVFLGMLAFFIVFVSFSSSANHDVDHTKEKKNN